MDSQNVRNETRHPEDWQDDPMAAQAIKEQVAGRNGDDRSHIEPEEHARGIRRPEVIFDPLYKPAVEQRLIQKMNNVCCEKYPKEQAQEQPVFLRLSQAAKEIARSICAFYRNMT